MDLQLITNRQLGLIYEEPSKPMPVEDPWTK